MEGDVNYTRNWGLSHASTVTNLEWNIRAHSVHILPIWRTGEEMQIPFGSRTMLSEQPSVKRYVRFARSCNVLRVVLALLRVVLSARSRPQLLWRWSDEKKTRVTFRHLFMVVHVSPLSLPHWGASVVRVRVLMLWPGWLVPESSSGAVLVAGWTVTTASASGVDTSVSSPVCGADAWHVGPLGHYLQAKKKKKAWTSEGNNS